MAQPFYEKRLVTTAESAPVVDQVRSTVASGIFGSFTQAIFSVSGEGLLAYQRGPAAAGLGDLSLRTGFHPTLKASCR